MQAFLQMADIGQTAGACPVVIVATSATDKSRTAKLLAKRDDGFVAMFYPPDLRAITADVRAMADAAGLRLGGDLAERIARAAGLDVRLAQSEVDKLALYLDASPQSPKLAEVQAHEDIGAKTEEDGLMPLVNVVLSGEVRKLPAELQRMREVGLSAVGVTLALECPETGQAGYPTCRLAPDGLGQQPVGRPAPCAIAHADRPLCRRQALGRTESRPTVEQSRTCTIFW